MAVPTVLLVRHGRTAANAGGVLAGWTPGVGLDETGRRQAVGLGARMASLPLAVGTLVSFAVAYASIAWLLRFVAHHPITVFVGYRVAAGVLLALALAAGVITAT